MTHKSQREGVQRPTDSTKLWMTCRFCWISAPMISQRKTPGSRRSSTVFEKHSNFRGPEKSSRAHKTSNPSLGVPQTGLGGKRTAQEPSENSLTKRNKKILRSKTAKFWLKLLPPCRGTVLRGSYSRNCRHDLLTWNCREGIKLYNCRHPFVSRLVPIANFTASVRQGNKQKRK